MPTIVSLIATTAIKNLKKKTRLNFNFSSHFVIIFFISAQSLMSNQVRSAHSTVSGWGGDHYLHNQARSRLDARLWLTCRLALARGLAEEDGGMGKLGGSTRSVTSAIGSCLHHCQQGILESR